MRRFIRLGLVFAIALAPATAVAQQTTPVARADARAGDYVEKNENQSQSVIFRDDPLAALPLSGTGATILVRPSGARMGLLHPRTHFIPEMLKSVEAL